MCSKIKSRRSKKVNFNNFTKLFTCLALAYTVSLTPVYAQVGSEIVPDKSFTTKTVNGSAVDVNTTYQLNGGTGAGLNSFSQFNVNGGEIVNLHVPNAGGNTALINLINDTSASFVNGVVKSYVNGNANISGNVFLVNPYGVIVGNEGVINVGSLTVVTPTESYMNSLFDGNGNPVDANVVQILNAGSTDGPPINPDGTVINYGKINAVTNVTMDTGSVSNYGKIYTNAEFSMGDVVNLNTLEEQGDPANLTLENGTIYFKTEYDVNNSGNMAANSIHFLTNDTRIAPEFDGITDPIKPNMIAGADINILSSNSLSIYGSNLDANDITLSSGIVEIGSFDYSYDDITYNSLNSFLNATNNVTIDPTNKLILEGATINSSGVLTINKGDILNYGFEFNPNLITAGSLSSDFLTPASSLVLQTNSTALYVGNLDNIIIDGSCLCLTSLNLAAPNGNIMLSGIINIDGDITATADTATVEIANTAEISSMSGNLTLSGHSAVITGDNSYLVAESGTISLFSPHEVIIGANSTVISNGINDNKRLIVNNLEEVDESSNITPTISGGNIIVGDVTAQGTKGIINITTDFLHGSGTISASDASSSIDITNNSNNNLVVNNLILTGATTGQVIINGVSQSSGTVNGVTIYVGDPGSEDIDITNTTSSTTALTGNIINKTGSINITNAYGNILDSSSLNAERNITMIGSYIEISSTGTLISNDLISLSSPLITLNGTVTSTGINDKLLLVNVDNTIDSTSNIAATIASGNISVNDTIAHTHGGYVKITGNLSGSGTVNALAGSGSIDITNNSNNNLIVNNLELGPVMPADIVINGISQSSGNFNGVTINVENPLLSDIDITNNTAAKVALTGNIINQAGSINVTNTDGDILDNINSYFDGAGYFHPQGPGTFIIQASNNITLAGNCTTVLSGNIIAGGDIVVSSDNSSTSSFTGTILSGNIDAGEDISILNTGPQSNGWNNSYIFYNSSVEAGGNITFQGGSYVFYVQDNSSLDAGNNITMVGSPYLIALGNNSNVIARNNILITAPTVNLNGTINAIGNTSIISNNPNIITANITSGSNTILSRLTAGNIKIGSAGILTSAELNRITGNIIIGNDALTNNLTTSISLVDQINKPTASVTLSANNNITDNRTTEDANIIAQNINLISTSGTIGTTTNDIDTNLTGGTLKATAYGVVNITETDGNMNIISITSTKNNVYLTTLNGSILDSSTDELPNVIGRDITLNSTNGTIGTSDNNLNVDTKYGSTTGKLTATALKGLINIAEYSSNLDINNVTSQSDVILLAAGSIRDASSDELPNIYARNLSITSQSGTIGISGNNLNIDTKYGSTTGNLTANALGGLINISEYDGDLEINYVQSKYDVVLTSFGNILDGGTDELPNIYGKNITLTSQNGTIGSVSENLNIDSKYGSSVGKLNATALSGLINIAEASGNLDINVVKSQYDVTIVSAGSILDASSGELPNIYGKSINLTATAGTIGTSSNDLDIDTQYNTTVGTLTASANSTTGLINISEYSGNLNLNTVRSLGNVTIGSAGTIYTDTVLPIINLVGKNLKLTSPISIGSVSNPIEIQTSGSVTTSSPVVYVHKN